MNAILAFHFTGLCNVTRTDFLVNIQTVLLRLDILKSDRLSEIGFYDIEEM